MPRHLVLPSLLALLLAAPLAAQPPSAPRRPPSDSVPRELVLALLQGSDGLRVGEPAGDLPHELLPPNGIVLGSVEYSGTSTTLVVLMQPEHEAIEAHKERARAAGWRPPPSAAYAAPLGQDVTRGFVPSALGGEMRVVTRPMSPMGVGLGTTRATSAGPLCKEGTMLMASSSPWAGGRTLLRLQPMIVAEYSPCRPHTPEAQPAALIRHVTVYDSIIPVLQPPPGAQVRPGGAGGGGDDWEMRTEMETTMTSAELLAHYAGEMTREGWSAVGDAAAMPMAAVQVWRRADDGGRVWHATLTFTGRADARRFRGSLRLERDRPQ